MKLIPISHHPQYQGPETVQGPLPSPQRQSDAERTTFTRSEDIPFTSPEARRTTAEFRIEFSDIQPTGPDAKKMLAQIERGKIFYRVNSNI